MLEKSAWELYQEKNKQEIENNTYKPVKLWHLLHPKTEYVQELVAKDRFDICKSCPELTELTSRCKKCGCFMKLKTTIAQSQCPLGKW